MTKIVLLIYALVNLNSCQEKSNTTANPEQEILEQENSTLDVKDVLDKTMLDSGSPEIKEKVNSGIQTTESMVQDEKSSDEIIASDFNHSIWTELLQKYVTDEGLVSYKDFKANASELDTYLGALSAHVPDNSWSRNEKLAYWINAYNAFTVKLIIDRYPVKSIKDIKSPWDIDFIQLGDKQLSLNEIEHEILRKMDEPRIHFAIVCASISCPKLLNVAFEAETLETQLTEATKTFLADPNRNNLSKDKINISKIFKWFAKDFKTNGSLIDFLNRYSDIVISKDADKSYKDYDWNLNE